LNFHKPCRLPRHRKHHTTAPPSPWGISSNTSIFLFYACTIASTHIWFWMELYIHVSLIEKCGEWFIIT
jgi:hypothetical protein